MSDGCSVYGYHFSSIWVRITQTQPYYVYCQLVSKISLMGLSAHRQGLISHTLRVTIFPWALWSGSTLRVLQAWLWIPTEWLMYIRPATKSITPPLQPLKEGYRSFRLNTKMKLDMRASCSYFLCYLLHLSLPQGPWTSHRARYPALS